MKKYIFSVVILSVSALLFFSSSAFAQNEKVQKMKGGAEYRGDMENVVAGLKAVAAKDRNIKEDVEKVAKEREDAKEVSAAAIKSVENRSRFKTFFLGTDYKNLGALRSAMVSLDNHISRLEKAKERAVLESVKAGLDTQIAALQAEKAKVEAFVKANESKFSLLGWFMKRVNK